MDGGLILLSGITIASSLARHLAVTLWAVRALFGYCSCIELQNNMRLLPVRCLDSYSGKVPTAMVTNCFRPELGTPMYIYYVHGIFLTVFSRSHKNQYIRTFD